MDASTTRQPVRLPERGQPRLASCEICGHQHACYVADGAEAAGPAGSAPKPYFVCLGCLMRAADPSARTACAECVFPA